jgi:FkbM family methyltransferase
MNVARISGFLRKPPREQAESLRNRWQQAVAAIPRIVRLPFGAWFVARNDNIGEPIKQGIFEGPETAFVGRLLAPGMTVLDLGANQGYYTLLASRTVGKSGRVFSFEPSPRERKALALHKRLNRCKNVTLVDFAVGAEERDIDLYVVRGHETGCNSLRPPIAMSESKPVRVKMIRLDDWLQRERVSRVDFIKLDVEGGEFDALKGAEALLERRPRPVLMIEVQDLRTRPWGYRAREIIEHLNRKEFHWFRVNADGAVTALDQGAQEFEGNFIACPDERLDLAHRGN